ncbi:MAG: lysozyme [Alphaproteobacteria bacterium]|nr:lysozyme [Alphaproteobacteria bacterium]
MANTPHLSMTLLEQSQAQKEVTVNEAFYRIDALRKDLRVAEQAVMRLIHVPLTQNQFDALVSFTFNLGSGALQRSTLRRKINRGEHEAAAREFSKWVFAGGKRLSGLVRRRQAEGKLYMKNSVL